MRKAPLLGACLLSVWAAAAAWAGPFSPVPKDHWAYGALQQLVSAHCLDSRSTLPWGELSYYEIGQLVINAVQRWGKIEPSLAPDQASRVQNSLVRLIDEFSETLRLFNVSPQSMKSQLQIVAPPAPSTAPESDPAAMPLTASGKEASKDAPVVMALPEKPRKNARTTAPTVLGSLSLDSPLVEFASRIQPNALMESLLDDRRRVEVGAAVGPLLVRSLYQPKEATRSPLPGVGALSSEELPSAAPAAARGDLRERVPFIFSVDVSLPLSDKVRLLGMYSRALDDFSHSSSSWEAGALYSPGRLTLGASLQSLGEGLFERRVLNLFGSDYEASRILPRGYGQVQGVAGFVGYRWGSMDLAGRLEGYGDESFGILMRYTGQVGYRSLQDRLALGLTLTRSFSLGTSLLDVLDTSFGVGYAITPMAQLQLTYGQQDNYLGGVASSNLDRTKVLVGRLSISF